MFARIFETAGRHGRRWFAAAALVSAGLLSAGTAQAQVERDAAEIVGPEECAECHEDTTAIWRNTHHFATFREMPRDKKGIEIARNMGLRRIKEGSLCLDCHFTTTMEGGEREPIAGISCESCHGAGEGYLKVHSEFSGKEEETETAAEEAARWEKSEAAGMIRPHMMYKWAKNCYSCHVVPQEKLVNVGGHPAGSDFELVAWSQGEVRHNVWYTEGESNPPADTDRRRKMFVIGMAVELETALRAVGEATQRADYAVAMAKRADRARKRFAQATELVGKPAEMAAIVQAANAAGLKLNNKAELTAAADKVAAETQKIVDNYDGSEFAALDPAIPGEDKWKGQPSQ
jgi:hypothetical protein